MNKFSESVNKLQKYEVEGYLFHGTPDNSIDIFEPRLASDIDPSKKFNNDSGVFLAVDPAAAIAFAIINTSDDRWPRDKSWSVGSKEKRSTKVYFEIPIECKELCKNAKGLVYVFKRDSDLQDGGWQLKSKNSITPIDKIEVNLSDLEFFNDRITWI